LFKYRFSSATTEENKEGLIAHEDFQLSARIYALNTVNQQYKLIRTHSL